MSSFRKISGNGTWQKGTTISFEVYEPYTEGGEGSCSIAGIPGYTQIGAHLYGSDDTTGRPTASGNLLFTNNNADLTGGAASTSYSTRTDVGSDWYKYTIALPAGLTNGIYYLKYSTYNWCLVFG